ncbi:hypothetical protein BDZ97DRAFT_1819744 [Flammula alnicola]|nr:hypothetical protein BDZ97DRAFT_1819744 [Flammula alnicola]
MFCEKLSIIQCPNILRQTDTTVHSSLDVYVPYGGQLFCPHHVYGRHSSSQPNVPHNLNDTSSS